MIVLLQFRKYGPKAYVDRMKEITDSRCLLDLFSYESTSIYILEAELNSYREMQNGCRYYKYVVPAGSQSDASTSVALLSVALLRITSV